MKSLLLYYYIPKGRLWCQCQINNGIFFKVMNKLVLFPNFYTNISSLFFFKGPFPCAQSERPQAVPQHLREGSRGNFSENDNFGSGIHQELTVCLLRPSIDRISRI